MGNNSDTNDIGDSITVNIDSIMTKHIGELKEENSEKQVVRVCGRRKMVSRCDSNQEAQDVNTWFSRVLGVKCRLMISSSNDGNVKNAMIKSSFKNDQPFLVVTKESILKLSAMSGQDVSQMVFRPSFVVERADKNNSEHNSEFIYNWKALIISQFGEAYEASKIRLTSCGPCQRCSMINVDPLSGKNDKNILQLLKGGRSDLQAKTADKVYFGEFFTYHEDDVFFYERDLNEARRLRRGDRCQVIR